MAAKKKPQTPEDTQVQAATEWLAASNAFLRAHRGCQLAFESEGNEDRIRCHSCGKTLVMT